MRSEVQVRPFRPEDQDAARAVILGGLRERWGRLDEGLNGDLVDIGRTYGPGGFVVAHARGALVATGGFLPISEACVQIHRVSVDAAWRRCGVGVHVVAALLDLACRRGFRSAILETTESWSDAIAFWRAQGFQPTERRDGNRYFVRALGPPA